MSQPDPIQPTLLVVDDDPFQRKVLGAWLAEAGWRVHQADDGDQALGLLAGVEVMLIDLRLAGSDGFELARRVTDLALDRPPVLVAMSADMPEEVRRRCRRSGFDHTLSKPFQRLVFLQAMQTVLARSRGQESLAQAPGIETAAPTQVPESLRDVPALAALWRMERRTGEPELLPAVAGLHQAGRLLVSAADDRASTAVAAVAAAAHGLAGAAGILGCTRVEATSKALASRLRQRLELDDDARLLVTVIESELDRAVEELKRKIAAA